MSARRRISGMRVALISAATAPGASIVVVLTVAVIALIGAIAPALVENAETATVRSHLATLRPDSIDPASTLRGPVFPGPSPGDGTLTDLGADAEKWGQPFAGAERILPKLPHPLRDVLGPPRVFVAIDGRPAVPAHGAAPANRVQIVLDPLFAGRVRFVEGAMPEPNGPDDQVVQLALSRDAAEVLHWHVGEVRHMAGEATPTTVQLVGVYEVKHASDRDWTHQRTGLKPGLEISAMGDKVHLATAYAAPGMLSTLGPLGGAASTTVWFPLRVDRIDGPTAATVAAQLRGFAGENFDYSVNTELWFQGGLAFSTAAPAALEEGAASGAAMVAIVTLAAIGPLLVAIVAAAMTGRMRGIRRAGSVRLARARGGSVVLLSTLLAAEGLVLGAIGAGIGVVAAALTVGWAGPIAAVVPVIVALTPAVTIPVTAFAAARRSARADLGVASRPVRRRRLFVEASVVVAAVVVVVAMLGKGTGVIDPIRATVPAALAAIGCVIVLRLVPWVLTAVEAALKGGRGVMAVLGPARARRGRTLPVAPALAAIVCVAGAMFAVVFGATVTAGLAASARDSVGADVQVTGTSLDAPALRAVPGVDAVAAVSADVQLPANGAKQWVTLTVYAVDTAEVARVQAGVPGALPLPHGLSDAGKDSVTAVASQAAVDSLGGAELAIHGVDVHIASTVPAAAFAPVARWIVIDRANAERILGAGTTTRTALVSLRPGADPAVVAASLRTAAGDGGRTLTPAQVIAERSADPALATVQRVLAASPAIAAVLLVFAVTMTLLRGSPSRGRMMGLLQAQGYPRGRELPLVAWEVGPPLLIALPVGLAVGVLLPMLLLPDIDLTRFVGGRAQPDLALAGWIPLAVSVVFVVIAAIGIALAALVASRVSAASALRRLAEEEDT
ncbi:FtsX-like permease family protein [Microbacterium terrisoli]|uniref:FtsX-like permease family protein n=1 Tax=Microbacterium terrisoli TaxID=3242192 RepID=UPI0028059417|nr:FtsX-like permease family protein [Microbacterium protaetiae]